MYAAFFLGSLYLEHVLGYSAIRTGLGFLPMSLGIATSSLAIAPRLMRRVGGQRTVLLGLASATAGLAVLTQVGQHTSYFPGVFLALGLLGLGAGLGFLPLLTIAMSEVRDQDAGLASGIVNVSMQISAALGLAILGTLATDHSRALAAAGDPPKSALLGGYHLSFAIGAICVAVGIVVALAALRPPRPAEPQRLPVRSLPDELELGEEAA